MRYAFALFLILRTPIPASAQAAGGLGGIVRDATGLPLAGVELTVSGPGGTRNATSIEDGSYRFESLPAGVYLLKAVRTGFRESVLSVLVQTGSVSSIDVTMQPAYAETIVVTASKAGESLISAPGSMAVLGSQKIETSAADNFADLLREIPALNITQFGARDINVNTRGSTGILANSMLVMVDGRSAFQPLYGAVYWDLMTVTKDEISQIEVLRSPASALWGANALSGVINLRTKSPRQMQGLRGNLGFGERHTKTAGVTWADATPRFSYKLSGSYFEQDPWKRDNVLPDGSPMPATVIFRNRGTKQPKFDARIDWDGDAGHTWSLRGGLAGANGLIHSALGPGEFQSGSYFSYVEVDRNSRDLDVKLYWNRLDAPFQIVLFSRDEDATNDTYVADVTRRMRAGDRHSLTFGGSVRLDRFDITIAPADHQRLDAGAFVEDRLRVSRLLSLALGGRLDKFDTTSAVFAPRLGAILSLAPAHSLHVAYNRAYRAPSLLENYVNVTLPAVVPLNPPFIYTNVSLGSTDLKMERQDAVEAGYTGVLFARTTVTATVYDQRVADNIWFLPVAFYGAGAPPPGWPLSPALVPLLPKVFSFINLGQVRDRGLELGMNVEWPRLSLQGSYTFQADPRLKSGTTLPLQINRPSRHQAGGGITYVSGQWSAGGDIHYTDRAFWADVFTEPFWGYTDAFVNVNARVTRRLPDPRWELWLTTTDLLDAKIKSHVFGDTVRRKITAGIRWELQ